jgi:Zn-dependent protease with chaperone function
MVSLRVFLMIVGTLVVQQVSKRLALPASGESLLAVFGYCVAFSVIGKFATVLSIWNEEQLRATPAAMLERFHQYRSRLESAWTMLLPVGLLATGWGSVLQQAAVDGWSHALLLALWLAPTFAFLLVLDLCTAQLESHLAQDRTQYRRLQLTPGTLVARGGMPTVPHLWCLQIRFGPTSGAILCAAPMLGVMVLLDATRGLLPGVGPTVQAALAAGVVVVALVAVLPGWLGSWLGATPLPPSAHRERIRDLSAAAQVHLPAVMEMGAESGWESAAVVGWSRWNRQLWLSRSLLEQLSPAELDMVVLHELAHLRRQHFLWRIAPVVATALAAACLLSVGEVLLSGSDSGAVGGWPWLSKATWDGAVAVAVIAGMIGGLGWMSRRCELDADRQACTLAAEACAWTGGTPRAAAAALESALRQVCRGDTNGHRAAWLHPALEVRCANLNRLG